MRWDGPPIEAWSPWEPLQAAAALRALSSPWCVVGGWALDLWLGCQTRIHSDIEITVPRQTLEAVLTVLHPLRPHVVGDGEVVALAPGELPQEGRHQVWMLDAAAAAWRVDIMLEPGDEEVWVYRRDDRLKMPRQRAQSARSGLPYLNPELVLLFKAKSVRDKDRLDYATCAPRLDRRQRASLLGWLRRFYPEHDWILSLEQMGDASSSAVVDSGLITVAEELAPGGPARRPSGAK